MLEVIVFLKRICTANLTFVVQSNAHAHTRLSQCSKCSAVVFVCFSFLITCLALWVSSQVLMMLGRYNLALSWLSLSLTVSLSLFFLSLFVSLSLSLTPHIFFYTSVVCVPCMYWTGMYTILCCCFGSNVRWSLRWELSALRARSPRCAKGQRSCSSFSLRLSTSGYVVAKT